MLYVKYKKERRYKMKKIKEISFFCMVLVVSLIFSEKVFAVSNVSPTSLTYFVEKLDLREKKYTMYGDEKIEEIMSTRKKIGATGVLGKVFDKIFD